MLLGRFQQINCRLTAIGSGGPELRVIVDTHAHGAMHSGECASQLKKAEQQSHVRKFLSTRTRTLGALGRALIVCGELSGGLSLSPLRENSVGRVLETFEFRPGLGSPARSGVSRGVFGRPAASGPPIRRPPTLDTDRSVT